MDIPSPQRARPRWLPAGTCCESVTEIVRVNNDEVEGRAIQEGHLSGGETEEGVVVSRGDFLAAQVLPCSVRRVHDWTLCNFTHPGEKIRRRDPQTHSYTGIACPDMKKVGYCAICSGEGRSNLWRCPGH